MPPACIIDPACIWDWQLLLEKYSKYVKYSEVGRPMRKCTWLLLILSPGGCHSFRHWCGRCGCNHHLNWVLELNAHDMYVLFGVLIVTMLSACTSSPGCAHYYTRLPCTSITVKSLWHRQSQDYTIIMTVAQPSLCWSSFLSASIHFSTQNMQVIFIAHGSIHEWARRV